jgi:hypothetical protein
MVSFSKKIATAFVVVFLVATTNAHMIMKTPTPYGKSTLDNSPLLADGSDFPCKQRTGVYDAEGAENIMTIGEPQTLSFTGSAVHGGGSCQVSLTTDLQPSASTEWMVIKSIEGGCPSNVTGNLPADANGDGAAVFDFTIPDGIAPGSYTIAWSWVNKIGNREYYMNCGPATVIAPKKRWAPAPQKIAKRETTFPDMFVANLASVNDCVTEEGFDYYYPDPGSVTQTAGNGPYTTLSCGAAAGSNAAETPTASADASGAAATATSADASSSAAVFATGAASASASASSATSAAPIAATGASTNDTGSSNSSTAGTQSGACSDEGAWACSADGSSFQRCASGAWSASIEMAAGTACTPGVSDTFTEVVTGAKAKRHSHGLRRVARILGGSH